MATKTWLAILSVEKKLVRFVINNKKLIIILVQYSTLYGGVGGACSSLAVYGFFSTAVYSFSTVCGGIGGVSSASSNSFSLDFFATAV